MGSIRENIESLRKELPAGVELVAVSKYHPESSVQEAYDAGQRDFAESRPQELQRKVQLLPKDIRWHFIGHLQTNKLKMVLPYACLVQSVDSLRLLGEIDKWGRDNGKVVPVLLELHIGQEETKQGFAEEEILQILFSADKYRNVSFRGLMGMASNTTDEETVDADFERIDSFMAYLVDLFPELPDFRQLSIGMSGDWKLALRHGSTMVRIGTSIFGERA